MRVGSYEKEANIEKKVSWKLKILNTKLRNVSQGVIRKNWGTGKNNGTKYPR